MDMMCTRCKERFAVVFMTRLDGDKTINEGLCLKCAKEIGLPQVGEMMRRMGITDEDLDMINDEMMSAFGGAESMEGLIPKEDDAGDEDGEDGKTATFPFLNRLFNSAASSGEPAPESPRSHETKERKSDKPPKRKYLDSYCINLTERARSGKLDQLVGREQEIERVVQILNRRQKNNPCLIGEPGVGKTAIAEGLAQRIANREVPFKLRDKEVYLMDLTALVAGTQFRGQFESRMKGLIEEIRKLRRRRIVVDAVISCVRTKLVIAQRVVVALAAIVELHYPVSFLIFPAYKKQEGGFKFQFFFFCNYIPGRSLASLLKNGFYFFLRRRGIH